MENVLFDYSAEFGKSFLQVIATLLPIMNPPGGAGMFLGLTNGASAKTRHVMSKKIAKNSFLMLIMFMLLGSFVLKFFGISKDIVLIAGGLLVVRMGWGIVNADNDSPSKHDGNLSDTFTPEKIQQTAFFPLTFPMTVGPGTLAACLTVGVSFTATSVPLMVARFLGALLGVIGLALIVRITYGYAEKVMKMLGETGAIVFLRISAFILLCIGVQLVWNGFANSFITLYNNALTP